jgi:ABC-type phosphate transport system ATPase subunit
MREAKGIGLILDHSKQVLRIQIRAATRLIETIGDAGNGKTTIIMQMLRQIQTCYHSVRLWGNRQVRPIHVGAHHRPPWNVRGTPQAEAAKIISISSR